MNATFHVRKLILLFSLVLCAFFAHSQSRFSQGYIVTNTGDTLSGLVNVRETDISPTQVTFKKTQADDAKKYEIDEVRYYAINNFYAYQRFEVSVSMFTVAMKDISGYRLDPAVRKTVFLKVLQQGKRLTLFSYRDNLKLRFYKLEPGETEPQELIYRVIKQGASYAEAFAFRDQLRMIADRAGLKNPSLEHLLKKTIYQESSMTRLAAAVNSIEVAKTFQGENVFTGLRIGAGVQLSSVNFYDNDEYAKNGKSSTSPGYWTSIIYDIAPNPIVGALVFRTELTVSQLQVSTATYDHRFSSNLDLRQSFTQHAATLGAGILLNIINKQKFKFFIGAGFRLNAGSYKKNDFLYTRTGFTGNTDVIFNKDTEPRKIWSSTPLRAGIVMGKRWEISVAYCLARPFSHDTFPFKYGISTTQAGLVYRFQ
jgi:hypothetical protein